MIKGKFKPKNEVSVTLLADGRKLRLNEDLIFIDPKKVCWIAPKGSIVDGASIPWFFWRVVGSPLVGKYRNASIVHDVYCVTKTKPHKQVHKMFYDAMLVGGVKPFKARIMYTSVAWFGPKWKF